MVKCALHPQSYKWEGNPKVTKVRELLSPSPVTYVIMKCSPNCSYLIKNASQCLRLKHSVYAFKKSLSLKADVRKKIFHLDKGY